MFNYIIKVVFFTRYLSIIMDACDQSDIDCPFWANLNPKDWTGGVQIQTKMGAVMIHGDEQTAAVYLFPTDQRTTKGANFWCTALTWVLSEYRDKVRGGKLPPKLYIQCDSASDNKNYTVAAYTEWLVRSGLFQKAKVCFLPVGHTHEDIDAVFGRLSKAFRNKQKVFVRTWAEAEVVAKQATKSTKGLLPISVKRYYFRCLVLNIISNYI